MNISADRIALLDEMLEKRWRMVRVTPTKLVAFAGEEPIQ